MKKINLSAIKVPEFKKLRKDTFMAILSYIHVLVLIPLIFGKKDEFVKYHAKQGFLLLALWVLLGFSLFLPYLPWLFIIVIAIGLVSGIVNVLLGRKRPMFLYGKYVPASNF